MPWHLGKTRGVSDSLTASSPFPLCSSEWGPLVKQHSSSQGPGVVPAYAGFSSLPTSRITSTNQSHAPIGTRGHLILLFTRKPAFHSPCSSILYLNATPVWPCMAWCSPSPGCEYIWLNCCQSHLSSVCHVLNHPYNTRTGLPPSPTRWSRGE